MSCTCKPEDYPKNTYSPPVENTSNTLDEILTKHGVMIMEDEYNVSNTYFRSPNDAKQAILQWVADEVVGIDAGYISHHGDILLQKQKTILKQHGWKEES